ncbi:hypothetical protein DEJ00_09400 [Curtobacterium sp. MCLR17_039]|nr:hypothetical protein DEJ00_09400 [Curtobacterium sp. MCLR17_039]
MPAAAEAMSGHVQMSSPSFMTRKSAKDAAASAPASSECAMAWTRRLRTRISARLSPWEKGMEAMPPMAAPMPVKTSEAGTKRERAMGFHHATAMTVPTGAVMIVIHNQLLTMSSVVSATVHGFMPPMMRRDR